MVPTTTALLLSSLEAILFEIGRIDSTVDDAIGIASEDRSTLKREIAGLRERGDRRMAWLSDQRLEAPKN
jgi:hypothetical protein